ncbi:MAG: hypothetical protein ACRCXT_21835, partial [Paraclostridium sp.]
TIKLIKSYIDKFDYEVFEEVFISSSGSDISNVYKYIKQVFQELEEKNIRTIHDYELDYKSYKNKKRQSAKAESQTNNNTIIPYNKNKFHNFTSNHPKYTEKEILEKQSKKFNN